MKCKHDRASGEAMQLTTDDVRELLRLIDYADTHELHIAFRSFSLSVRKKLEHETAGRDAS